MILDQVLFKYSTMAGRIYDILNEILNEEVEEMAVTDPEKAVFLPALSHLGHLQTSSHWWGKVGVEHRAKVHTVGEASPTVFLLTSGNMCTLPQALRAAARLDYLGFRIVAVQGVANKDELHSQGVPKKARAGHMAWLLAFLPKLLSLVQDLAEFGKFLVAEDSCWPTSSATPAAILEECQKHEGKCVWLGYRTCTRNGILPMCRVTQSISKVNGKIMPLETIVKVRAPFGLKWLILDKARVRLLYRAFCQLGVDTCAEHYFKMLLASEDLVASTPPLAGSDEHYSLVDGKWQEANVAHSICGNMVKTKVSSMHF